MFVYISVDASMGGSTGFGLSGVGRLGNLCVSRLWPFEGHCSLLQVISCRSTKLLLPL